jgi:hypothetical protein
VDGGEGEFVGVVGLAHVDGGGRGKGGPGVVHAEEGIEAGEGLVGLVEHAFHFGAHAVGGVDGAPGGGRGEAEDGETGEQGRR